MIELNLIPKDLQITRKKSASQLDIKLPKVAPIPLIVGLIGIIILSQAILGLLAVMQQKKLTVINSRLNDIMPQQKIAEALKKEVDLLSGKVTVINSLTLGSLVWANKLYDLNNAVIDGVWLNSLSLNTEKEKGSRAFTGVIKGVLSQGPDGKETLVLKGAAISSGTDAATAIVGRFIHSLKTDEDFFKDFEDIKLSSVQRETLGNTEIMNFTIICYFKSGRSYFEKL
jgi:hypothetical protein